MGRKAKDPTEDGASPVRRPAKELDYSIMYYLQEEGRGAPEDLGSDLNEVMKVLRQRAKGWSQPGALGVGFAHRIVLIVGKREVPTAEAER